MKGNIVMGYFEEIDTVLLENGNDFDKKLSYIKTFTEMVLDEYKDAMESANLTFMTESVSDEDLAYGNLNTSYMEATENLSAKLTKSLDKLLSMFKEFCDKISLSVKMKYTGATFESKITKISKKVKENPFIGKQKITFTSLDLFDRSAAALEAIASKWVLKLNKSEYDKNGFSEFYNTCIENINDEIEFYKSTKPGKTTVTMTIDQFINNAIASNEYGTSVIKFIENTYKRESKVIDRIKKYAKMTTDPEIAKDAQSIAAHLTTALKENINAYLRSTNEAFKKCNDIIKSCEKTNKSANDQKSEEKSVKESVDDVSSKVGFEY